MFSENIHNEIFSDKQIELIPYLKEFHKTFYLVGGTAVALYVGHRRAIGFS